MFEIHKNYARTKFLKMFSQWFKKQSKQSNPYINYKDRAKISRSKMGIDQIEKKFVKSMSVKKFSYLGQFIQGLRTPEGKYVVHIMEI